MGYFFGQPRFQNTTVHCDTLPIASRLSQPTLNNLPQAGLTNYIEPPPLDDCVS